MLSPDAEVVCLAGPVSGVCVHLGLIARLTVVGLIHKDQRLYADKHLHCMTAVRHFQDYCSSLPTVCKRVQWDKHRKVQVHHISLKPMDTIGFSSKSQREPQTSLVILTCSVVETAESQPSPLPPLHVPSSERHTCSERHPGSSCTLTTVCLWLQGLQCLSQSPASVIGRDMHDRVCEGSPTFPQL